MNTLHCLLDTFQQSLAIWGIVPFQIAVHICERIHVCFKILLADWALNKGKRMTQNKEIKDQWDVSKREFFYLWTADLNLAEMHGN